MLVEPVFPPVYPASPQGSVALAPDMGQYASTSQGVQPSSTLCASSTVPYVPMGQGAHAPPATPYVPAAQEVHVLAPPREYWPRSQATTASELVGSGQ